MVNLLVTPAQAEILSLAGNKMHVQLVLRNPGDTGISTPPGIVLSDLLGGVRPATPLPSVSAPPQRAAMHQVAPAAEAFRQDVQAAPPLPYTIQVSNGSIHTEARFNRVPEKP